MGFGHLSQEVETKDETATTGEKATPEKPEGGARSYVDAVKHEKEQKNHRAVAQQAKDRWVPRRAHGAQGQPAPGARSLPTAPRPTAETPGRPCVLVFGGRESTRGGGRAHCPGVLLGLSAEPQFLWAQRQQGLTDSAQRLPRVRGLAGPSRHCSQPFERDGDCPRPCTHFLTAAGEAGAPIRQAAC